MAAWTPELEAELSQLLKDWLKQQGRTQADLRRSLKAVSTRMPALLEVLEREHRLNGLSGLVARLCRVEAEWQGGDDRPVEAVEQKDPFGQLDLLLQEIRQDCPADTLQRQSGEQQRQINDHLNVDRCLHPTWASPQPSPCCQGAIGRLDAGPGSRTGKDSKVVPTNCVTMADGAVSCDTKLETPASNTPARPY